MKISVISGFNYSRTKNNPAKKVSFGYSDYDYYKSIGKDLGNGDILMPNGAIYIKNAGYMQPPPPPPSDQMYTEECNGGSSDD